MKGPVLEEDVQRGSEADEMNFDYKGIIDNTLEEEKEDLPNVKAYEDSKDRFKIYK